VNHTHILFTVAEITCTYLSEIGLNKDKKKRENKAFTYTQTVRIFPQLLSVRIPILFHLEKWVWSEVRF